MDIKFQGKLLYLDGLRGIASVMVFLLHFILTFLPAAQRGNSLQIHNSFELWLASSPFNIIYGGHFAVCIFFVLSGYVLSAGFFRNDNKEKVFKSFLKRYIRLEIPIFVSIVMSYLLLKFNLYANIEVSMISFSFDWLNKQWILEPDFLGMLKQSFITLFFSNDYAYNSNLWTMQIELFGSYIVYSFLLFFGRWSFRPIIYVFLLMIFWHDFYLAFILGVILSDFSNGKSNYLHYISRYKSAALLFLMVGIVLGSFNFINIEHTFYRFIKIDWLADRYKIIGAFFVVLAVLCSEKMQTLLEYSVFQFLGKISFSLYLIHLIVLGSFSCNLFLYLQDAYSYNLNILIVFIFTAVLVFTLSWYLYKYVDLFGISLSSLFAEKVINIWHNKNKFFD